MDTNLFTLLAQKYIDGTATEAEKELVETYYAILSEGGQDAIDARMLARVEASLFSGVRQAIRKEPTEVSVPVHRVHFLRRYKWIAAAVLLFAIGGTYFLLQPVKHQTVLLSQSERFKNDIKPGKKGAILRLDNGVEILTDTAANGMLAEGFTKTNNGLMVAPNRVQFASFITPKAHADFISLSDGTGVWLNAGSSIRFPTNFTGNTREVEITGEVYFEVTRNKTKPFIVHTPTDKIEVLGTHFNVNAYGEVKTTLLEGSVKISGTTIKPGDQYRTGKIVRPDVEQVMAWKDGRFLFDDAGIKEIMSEVERWYDVEIVYKDNIQNTFVADIRRDLPVSDLLKILEFTNGVHFEIDGRKITVMK